MKFAFSFANFGYLADAQVLANLSVDAEQAGWDAVFIWDHVNWVDMGDHVDPWIALGLIADRTTSVLLGTGITPIARRRPTKLAREILTLHKLSGGRFVFGAGNGVWPSEFDDLGDPGDLKVRAEMLDEGLALLKSLWSGKPTEHKGAHFTMKAQAFTPHPVDIPIWLAATWPNRKPFRRAAGFDGVMAVNQDFVTPLTITEVKDISQYVAINRDGTKPFNLSVALSTSGDMQADIQRALAYEDAGANWWQDSAYPPSETFKALQARVRRGPPRA
jgi:alkanesulfonate monooxygenase SsuD/methylene tetrahydromethanopterin reductase-like flavin-dependent oxidoreductase (luciferase family)